MLMHHQQIDQHRLGFPISKKKERKERKRKEKKEKGKKTFFGEGIWRLFTFRKKTFLYIIQTISKYNYSY